MKRLTISVAGFCLAMALRSSFAATNLEAPVLLGPGSLKDWQFVSDAQIAPDGTRIVYVLTRVDIERDTYDSDLWMIEGEQEPHPVVSGADEHAAPRWSPDGGKLAFIASAGERPQIFILDPRDGSTWPLTAAPAGVRSFAWSPDSKRIAYVSNTPAGEARVSGSALVTEQLIFRTDGGTSLRSVLRSKLFVTDATAPRATPVGPLTDGAADPSEPTWSADGQWVIYSALPGSDKAAIERDTDLYRVKADGSRAPERLTRRRGPDDDPVVAAATGTRAWSGYDVGDAPRSATSRQLYVMQPNQPQPHALLPEFDRNVGETLLSDATSPGGGRLRLAFSADGRRILFVAADRGVARLYEGRVEDGTVRSLSDQLQGDLTEFSVADSGRVAAVFGSPTQPYEVWTRHEKTGRWSQRTAHALSKVGDVFLSPYEEILIPSFDGLPLQAWLLKPPHFQPERKYPLILYVHGGPHNLYGEAFFHEFQVLAGAGFLVLIVNPRGSTGYGQEFANVIQYRYPGDDYRDLMTVLDSVAGRGYVDTGRLGVAGGSGGGLLSSWTISQTDRFAAAVVERPVTNWISMVLTSDRGAFIAHHWFRDYPWRRAGDYLEHSPIMLVERVSTPVLILHSQEDFRATVDQSVQYYTALRMLGKPARLAIFPRSSHSLWYDGPPQQRVQRLALILDWFKEKLRHAGN